MDANAYFKQAGDENFVLQTLESRCCNLSNLEDIKSTRHWIKFSINNFFLYFKSSPYSITMKEIILPISLVNITGGVNIGDDIQTLGFLGLLRDALEATKCSYDFDWSLCGPIETDEIIVAGSEKENCTDEGILYTILFVPIERDYFALDSSYEHVPKEHGTLRSLIYGWYCNNPEKHSEYHLPANEAHTTASFFSFHCRMELQRAIAAGYNSEKFKKCGTIGCRDLATKQAFERAGVRCAWTGCFTVTLNNPVPHLQTTDTIFVVDTILPEEYSGHKNVQYVTHIVKKIRPMTLFEKLLEAKKLLRMYATAQLVITSRLHCAMPCVGMGVPVIFQSPDGVRYKSGDNWCCPTRFEGIGEILKTNRDPECSQTIQSIRNIIRTNFVDVISREIMQGYDKKHWNKILSNWDQQLTSEIAKLSPKE